MAHFAEIDEGGIVLRVVVTNNDWTDKQATDWLAETHQGLWLKTSYNTFEGEHLLGGEPFRKNFASVGSCYNNDLDAFMALKPYESWLLNEEKGTWVAPVPYPTEDRIYSWDETNQSWQTLED